MTAIVQIGKTGDVLAALPLAQCFDDPIMMVAAEYAHVLKASDVPCHIYHGAWNDLAGAIIEAKKNYSKVVVPQVHGQYLVPENRHPSFQYDMYDRVEMLGKWDTLPLKLKHQQHPRMANTILFADVSESSKFPFVEDCYKLLCDSFPKHKIIRLSTIRLKSFTDFIGYYNAANALVTVETAHLHLSAASHKPVVALVGDMPSRWNGSAWSKRFSGYFRYKDYLLRKSELVWSLRDAMSQNELPVVSQAPTTQAHGYNLSIAELRGQIYQSYRWHPDPNSWRTQLVINEQPLVPPLDYADHSLEDARLFSFNGRLHAAVTIARNNANVFYCVTGYGELVNTAKLWSFKNFFVPRFGKNDWSGMEKNWVPFEHKGRLHFIYQCHPEQVVIQMDGDVVTGQWKSSSPEFYAGTIRGGTVPIRHGQQWLRFFHGAQNSKSNHFPLTYHVGALLMQPEPPFQITKVSSRPILSGDEQYYPGWKRWKLKVIIPYGAIPDGDGWRVALGKNDSICAEVRLKQNQLYL